jgi:hypothetical protein
MSSAFLIFDETDNDFGDIRLTELLVANEPNFKFIQT